jgi:hypothetical protein
MIRRLSARAPRYRARRKNPSIDWSSVPVSATPASDAKMLASAE